MASSANQLPPIKRKIAFLTSDLAVEGGVNRVLAELICGLHEDLEIDIISTEGGEPFYTLPDGLPILHLGKTPYQKSNRLWRAINTFMLIPKIVRNIEREKPQVVISLTVRPNVANVLAQKIGRYSYKTIICEHNFNSLQYSHSVIEVAFRKLMKLLYPHADAVVAVSNDLSRDLEKNFGVLEKNLYTIYNPLDLDRIESLAEAKPEFPWEQQNLAYFINVGRLTAQKNHALLLRAFKHVREEYDCRLLILGEGVLHDELENLIKTLGLKDQVFLLGWKSNPFNYLKNAQAFVLSSDYEGLPAVLVEALTCGCPIISTDCPTGPREILEDGKYGILVPVDSEQDLAAMMVSLLKNPEQRSAMADLGRERAKRFDRELIINQYRTLLSHLMETSPQAVN